VGSLYLPLLTRGAGLGFLYLRREIFEEGDDLDSLDPWKKVMPQEKKRT